MLKLSLISRCSTFVSPLVIALIVPLLGSEHCTNQSYKQFEAFSPSASCPYYNFFVTFVSGYFLLWFLTHTTCRCGSITFFSIYNTNDILPLTVLKSIFRKHAQCLYIEALLHLWIFWSYCVSRAQLLLILPKSNSLLIIINLLN